MEYLSNGILELEVSLRGAELRSLRRVACPTEYLWQGDPTYWDRRSPILFPNVGKVWQDTVRVGNDAYTLHQHGFLRDMLFRKTADEDRHLAFVCDSDETSLACYPFPFRVQIDYRLLRNVLTVEWTVENTGDQPLPFQIGAHPGFNHSHYNPDAPVHGYLSADAASPWISARCDGGFVHPIPADAASPAPASEASTASNYSTFPIDLPHDGLLPLTNETFACDTILEMTGRMHRITLHDADGRPWVTVRHQMPVTAIWSPCGGRAPFVCIEPWEGCCDPEGYDGQLRDRHYSHILPPQQRWTTSYDIIVE